MADPVGIVTTDPPPLGGKPVFDDMDARRLDLIRKTVAAGCSDGEIASFLELAARYDLDPFAKEVWCAKSPGSNGRPGRLLVMVGRDGLRKIAQRNGLEVEGAVVCEKDEFVVTRIQTPADLVPLGLPVGMFDTLGGGAPFHLVQHKRRGLGKTRGPVIGAWSRVYERGTKIERGYFDAPLEEYKPKTDSAYSPWNNQVSAMMLGAVERQATRQATPLGGLVHEGEADINLAAGDVAELAAPELPQAVLGVIDVARRVGHAALSDADTVAMQVAGRDDEYVAKWVADAMDALDARGDVYCVRCQMHHEEPVAVAVNDLCARVVGIEGGGGATVPVDADGDATADVQPVDADREQAGPGDWDPELNARLEAEAAQEDQR